MPRALSLQCLSVSRSLTVFFEAKIVPLVSDAKLMTGIEATFAMVPCLFFRSAMSQLGTDSLDVLFVKRCFGFAQVSFLMNVAQFTLPFCFVRVGWFAAAWAQTRTLCTWKHPNTQGRFPETDTLCRSWADRSARLDEHSAAVATCVVKLSKTVSSFA